MKIGIIIAIESELKAFLESGAELEEEQVCGKTIYRTNMSGHEVYATMTGYGLIDAAAATQLLITHTGCEVVINFGVAGAIIRELKVEDIFLGKKVETPNAKELHIALRSAMVAYARNHPKKEQIDNSITYACRLPWSFRGLLLHDYACIPALEPILHQNEVYQMALRDGLQ